MLVMKIPSFFYRILDLFTFQLKLRLLSLFLPVTLTTANQAQESQFQYDPSRNVVIATTGLNLRMSPSLTSEVLAVIPFGSKVDIIDDQYYGFDTLGTSYEVFFSSEESFTPKVGGYWVKGRFNEQVGYLFSAYLDWDHNAVDQVFNRDVALLFEGVNCSSNYRYDPSWHWYGCYKENGALVLKKIKLSFFLTLDEMTGFGISTNIKAPSYFIIGSKVALPKTILEGTCYSHVEGQSGYLYDHGSGLGINQSILQASGLEFFKNPANDWDNLLLLRGKNNKEQILNPSKLQLSSPMSILWHGDLDGDNETDYIINFGEESSQTVLYLSTHAGKGEVVRPVAAWFSGYCC